MWLCKYNLKKTSVLHISSRVDATFLESSIFVCYPTLSFCKVQAIMSICKSQIYIIMNNMGKKMTLGLDDRTDWRATFTSELRLAETGLREMFKGDSFWNWIVVFTLWSCEPLNGTQSSSESHPDRLISVLKGYSDNDPSSSWCPCVRAHKHRSLAWMMTPPLRRLVYIQSFSCSCWFTAQLSSFATPFTQLICNMADTWQLSAGGTPTYAKITAPKTRTTARFNRRIKID